MLQDDTAKMQFIYLISRGNYYCKTKKEYLQHTNEQGLLCMSENYEETPHSN